MNNLVKSFLLSKSGEIEYGRYHVSVKLKYSPLEMSAIDSGV